MKKILVLSAFVSALFVVSCSKEEAKEVVNTTPTSIDSSTIVAEKNMSLINKFTGTNCPPCGGWGWELTEKLISQYASDGIVVSTYSQNFVAQLFISPIATAWDKMVPVSGAYPTFTANFVDSWVTPVKDDIEGNLQDAVVKHNLAPVVVNSNHTYKYDGDSIVVNTTTKFFKEATGDFYLGVYVMEDKVIGNQAGNSDGANASHHNVLRGGNSSWGDLISSGTVAANKTFSKVVKIKVNSTWNKANLKVFTVIWKKNGTKYSFVNADN